MSSLFDTKDKKNPLDVLIESISRIYEQLKRAESSGLNNPAIQEAVKNLGDLLTSLEVLHNKNSPQILDLEQNHSTINPKL